MTDESLVRMETNISNEPDGSNQQLSKTHKPSTLWALFSMLKATVTSKYDCEFDKFIKLLEFLRKNAKGYKCKKNKILTPLQILKFLREAPDSIYLAYKVILLFGFYGACRRDEFPRLTLDDIQDHGNHLWVNIPAEKSEKPRKFKIGEDFYDLYKKYVNLRPPKVNHITRRLFIHYQNGRCGTVPIGIHKFNLVPKAVANYLKLPNAQSYTGQCYRQIAPNLVVNAAADLFISKTRSGQSSGVVEKSVDQMPQSEIGQCSTGQFLTVEVKNEFTNSFIENLDLHNEDSCISNVSLSNEDERDAFEPDSMEVDNINQGINENYHSDDDRGKIKQDKNVESTLRASNINVDIIEKIVDKVTARMGEYFREMEKNNERRHQEYSTIRLNELEIQKKMLALREREFEMKKKQIVFCRSVNVARKEES